MANAFILPHAEAADEGVVVVAQPYIGGKVSQLFGIATAQHDIVGLNRLLQLGDRCKSILLPFLLAKPLKSAAAEIILVCAAFFKRKMSKFHGLQDTIDDHRRSEAGPKAEQEHPSLLIAAHSLHGGVVYDFYGLTEGFSEMELNPSRCKVEWLADGAPLHNWSGIADRDHIVGPIPHCGFDFGNHLAGGKRWAGRDLAHLLLPTSQQLHIRAPDIDGQHFRFCG